MNPLSKEEFIQEITDSPTDERVVSQDTSPVIETTASSHRQEIGRQHSVEFSSARQQSKQGSDIKRKFTEIKAMNEPIRIQLYNHLLKMAPTNQQRLMSAYDIQEGNMILSHFKPKMLQPQSAADYIRTNLEVLAKDIQPMDQIELHKETGEMVYSTLANKALLAHKLQNSLNNTFAQLELEKASSLAKDNRIKSLEEIIIELGHDPKDPKGIQALIKKEEDIAVLRKQLMLPITMHPKTREIVAKKSQEDTMDLLIKMNERLAEKEKALEEALQGKRGDLASQPSQTAPIVTVAPPTITTAVPPTVPTSIEPSTSTTTVAGISTTMTTEELIKAMEDLRLHVS